MWLFLLRPRCNFFIIIMFNRTWSSLKSGADGQTRPNLVGVADRTLQPRRNRPSPLPRAYARAPPCSWNREQISHPSTCCPAPRHTRNPLPLNKMDGSRAHARNESVARMRVPHAVRQSPTKARPSPGLGPDSPAHTPVLDALQFIDQRRRRSVMLKLLAAGTVVLGALYLAYGLVEQQRITNLVRQRKHSQQGAGESHILPQRWREQIQKGSIDGETLPDCSKIMLFQFRQVASVWGGEGGGLHNSRDDWLFTQKLSLNSLLG